MFRTLNQPALWVVTLRRRHPHGHHGRPPVAVPLSRRSTPAPASALRPVGQFMWGAIQPVAGAVADRYGPEKVLVGGLLLLAAGSAITPFI